MKRATRILVFLAASLPLAAAISTAQREGTPAALLRAAMDAETVEGDLDSAIERYREVIAHDEASRQIVAQALLRLGSTYEKRGDGAAREAYERIVRDYADQAAVAVEARTRLAALVPAGHDTDAESTGLVARRILETQNDWFLPGAVSPDNREVAFVDWSGRSPRPDNTGDLGVTDVRTGETRIVGETSGVDLETGADLDTYVQAAAWSPDGTRLAYAEQATTWDHVILYIMNADGSERRVLSDNIQNRQIQSPVWSSDSRWIAAFVRGWDDILRIATFGAEDGSVAFVKTLDDRFPGLFGRRITLDLSPDDRYLAYTWTPEEGGAPDIHVVAVDGSHETVVAPHPDSDLAPFWSPDGSRLAFLSDRSGSADLWVVEMADGRAVSEAQVFRPRVGPVHPLGFTDDALTYATSVPGSTLRVVSFDETGLFPDTGAPLTDRFVGFNSEAAWSPDGSRVAYLSTRPGPAFEDENYLVVKSMVDGGERDFGLTLRPRRVRWSADGRQVLLESPDPETGTLSGYTIDPESGEVTREAYRWDMGGWSWVTSVRAGQRRISGRQSDRLRELGVRITGNGDAFGTGEPLRDGERVLWLGTGMGWLHRGECEAATRAPNVECGDDGWQREVVTEQPYPGMAWELSPDGSQLAYISPAEPESGNVRRVWVRSVSLEDEPRLLAEHSGSGCYCTLRWTPDGRDLLYAFQTDDEPRAHLYRIDAGGGEPEVLNWEITRQHLFDMTFDPTGNRAIVPVGDGSRTEVWAISGLPWEGEDQ